MVKPILIEPLSIERHTILIRDLPRHLEGTKLIHLSDFHYDQDCLSDSLLTQVITLSNQENPDLVLLTGDYINYSPSPIHRLAPHLRSLTSRYGTYAVLGNHDTHHPAARRTVTEALTAVGITVLWNAIATPLGDPFPLLGLADWWSEEFDPEPVFSQLDPGCPRLVLSHNPDSAAILQQWRVDLQLSGHTHGGQIRVPGMGSVPQWIEQFRQWMPDSILEKLPCLNRRFKIVKHWQWDQGLHRIDSNQLYVNRGLGTYFPGRLFCPPEMTILRLIRQ